MEALRSGSDVLFVLLGGIMVLAMHARPIQSATGHHVCAGGAGLPFYEGIVWNGNYGIQDWRVATFGTKTLGGIGGVSLVSQVIGTLGGVAVATLGSVMVYGILKPVAGLRLDSEAEFTGADLSIHKASATAERETNG